MEQLPFEEKQARIENPKGEYADFDGSNLPLYFGADYPEFYFSVPPEQRNQRVEMKESLCVVDEKHFFHRGRLIIPIIDFTDDLVFNVWTSISEDNFRLRNDLWNDPDRIKQPPYFGWLQTLIPSYGATLNLKTIAIESEVGFIPSIQMIEEDHLLTKHQKNGISLEAARGIIKQILQE